MPQTIHHTVIINHYWDVMQSLTLKSRQPEPTNILAESPVKERERIHINLTKRQNTSAMDVMGLSWIFAEDDC